MSFAVTRRPLLAGMAAAAMLAISPTVFAAPGDLDGGFANGGLVIDDLGPNQGNGVAALVDDDGRVLALGREQNATWDFVVFRYLADGNRDTSWGTNGKVTIDVSQDDHADNLAMGPDGSVYLVGTSGPLVSSDVAVVKLTPNGTLDTSFSGDGKHRINLAARDAGADLAVRPDGRLVVAGTIVTGDDDAVVFGLRADGAPDPQFAGGGFVTIDPGAITFADAVAVAEDGRVALTGESDGDVVTAVMTPSGALDTNFSGDGIALSDLGSTDDAGADLAFDAQGRLLVAARGVGDGFDFHVLKYNTNGTLHAGFGDQGAAVVSLSPANDVVRSLAIAPTGHIVAAGYNGTSPDRDVAVVRLTPDGDLDITFGQGGLTTTDPGGDDFGRAVAIGPDGTVYVVGDTTTAGTRDLLVVAYEGTAPAPIPIQCVDSFSDDDGHLFEGDVDCIATAGITRGCNPPTNSRFCPDDPVTRGQMAAFLNRALELAPGSGSFSDTGGHLFEADITALAAAGVTRGCNPPANTRFCPDDPVTRGQIAAFLTRALDLPSSPPGFTDTVGHVFESDIAALAAAGITRGCNPPDNTRFCPDDVVTRGQMAAFLNRALLP